MNLKFYFLALFTIALIPCYSQSNYYVMDSTMNSGFKVLSNGALPRSESICFRKKTDVVCYTPYEIREYGRRDRRIYVSKNINYNNSSKRVFMERIVKGRLTLYCYEADDKKTYFFEKDDSGLIELPETDAENKGFKDILMQYVSDCDNIDDILQFVGYKKRALKKFGNQYNICNLAPFPYIKYGVTVGSEFQRLILPDKIDNANFRLINFKYKGSISAGVFLDVPILVTNWSAYINPYFTKHSYSYKEQTEGKETFYTAEINSIKIPLSLKYTIPDKKLRQFFMAGGVFSYNFKASNSFFESTANSNIITIDKRLLPDISTMSIGFSIGTGIEYKLNLKKSLFFNLHYTNLYPLSIKSYPKTSAFSMSVGINL